MTQHRLREDDGPNPELLSAIDEAARGALPNPSKTGSTARLYLDALPRSRSRVVVLAFLLVIALVGGWLLALLEGEELPSARVEADLRLAVEHVVRRVETLRARTGRLPEVDDLLGLVSDLVVYEPLGDTYRVYGRRGDIRVEYDGSVPLDPWQGFVVP